VRSPRRCHAFTLIELVISISVGVIISGIAGSLLWNASKQRAEIAARGELVDVAAVAMEVMFRHVREIPQDECPANPTPCLLENAQVSTATSTELRFGDTGFRLNGGQVDMTLDNGVNWAPVVKDVSSFALTYYDRTATSLTSFPLSQSDREDIRRVGIDLELTRSSQTAHVRSSVFLRSFLNEVASDP
jgi:prepilin-type N-terminal cleavage/methylation domain-containing protein